jgi:hypothetical protein
MRCQWPCCIVALLAVASHAPAAGPEGPPEIVRAPALKKIDVVKTVVLKPCDGVIACPELDCLVLRRDKMLLQMSLVAPYEEKLLGEDEVFAHGRFLKAVLADQRLFVVLNTFPPGNSPEIGDPGHPILLDASRKRIVSLVPEGIKLVKGGGFYLTDFDVAPQRGGMVIGLSYGGPTGSSPRPPNNDPFYCWVNLREGTVKPLPDKFTPNYTEGSGRVMFSGRVAWDVQTGMPVADVPDYRKTPCYYYTGSYKGTARGLVLREEPGTDHIVGVAVDGKTYTVPFPKGLQYANEVHAAKDFACLYIRQADGKFEEALWIAPLDGKSPPRRLCRNRHILMEFAVLDGGHCLFVSPNTGRGRDRTRHEVFLYNYAKNQMWELLDGAGGLPALTEAEKKKYYSDSLVVGLTLGFGKSQRGPWALARLGHYRSDIRVFRADPHAPPVEARLPSRKWEKHMLISSQGDRYELDVPVAMDQEAFLHNQGTLVLKTPAPNTDGQPRDRREGQFHLTLFRLNLPE